MPYNSTSSKGKTYAALDFGLRSKRNRAVIESEFWKDVVEYARYLAARDEWCSLYRCISGPGIAKYKLELVKKLKSAIRRVRRET